MKVHKLWFFFWGGGGGCRFKSVWSMKGNIDSRSGLDWTSLLWICIWPPYWQTEECVSADLDLISCFTPACPHSTIMKGQTTIHAHAHKHSHHTGTQAHTHTHTHTGTHTHTHTHTHTNTHTQAHRHTHTHTHTHAHKHSHTGTQAHRHTHTHTHTHTPLVMFSRVKIICK